MFKFIYIPPDLKNSLVKEPQTIESKFVLEVSHFRQRFNWDCGISCVIMTLAQDTKQQFLENFSSICCQEGFNTSTWTIDLCYLLKRFNVKHLYCTAYLGVCDELNQLEYYRDKLDVDRDRVVEKIRLAHDNGIAVKKYSLTTDEMLQHMFANGPIIVLVDSNWLRCVAMKTLCRRCVETPSYVGHYVVVCGYSPATNKLYYRDPARRSRLCSISVEAFDKARKCPGTDEDTILIFNQTDNTK